MILERLGNAVVQAARESQGKPDHRGWVEITIPVESPERAAADLMTLGAEVEVLAPPELRQQMAATATAILLRHQAAASPKRKSRPAGRRRP